MNWMQLTMRNGILQELYQKLVTDYALFFAAKSSKSNRKQMETILQGRTFKPQYKK